MNGKRLLNNVAFRNLSGVIILNTFIKMPNL